MASTKVRIAGIQMDVVLGDVSGNLARMLTWLDSPGVAGAKLVVFPECALSGYCFNSLDEARPATQTIPGPATDVMSAHCRDSGNYVAMGMLESRGEDIYNSCVLIGPQGIVGVYRKVHLPYLGIDRFVTPGEEPYQVFDVDELKIGMHICYDASFPESTRVMALAGADLVILPTNWPPGADTFAKYLPNARALENNIYFFAVNRVGTERGFKFIGQSRLCDPNGNPLAEGPSEGEQAMVADIDFAWARRKRLVRVPGQHVIDRFADRRPQFYGPIAEEHALTRDIG